MKRLLLVMGAVALFSLTASAKSVSYNFQFLSVTGDPFCDGMVLNNSGTPQTLVDGTHFNAFCLGVNIPVNGFKAPVAPVYQYAGTGAVLIVGDGTVIIEEFCDGQVQQPLDFRGALGPSVTPSLTSEPSGLGVYAGMIYLINTATNTWTLWVSGDGAGEYVVNFGTLDPLVGPLNQSAKPSQVPSSHPPKSSFAR